MPVTALLVQVVMQYAGAQVIWCQEEPKNMGAWRYVKPRMDTAMRELMEGQPGSAQPLRIRYVGRPAAASPGIFYFNMSCLSQTTACGSKSAGHLVLLCYLQAGTLCKPYDDCQQVLHICLQRHTCSGSNNNVEIAVVVLRLLSHVCTAAV